MRKGQKRKRIGVVLLCLLVTMFCGGFLFGRVVLINADEPFIDFGGTSEEAFQRAQQAKESAGKEPEEEAKPSPSLTPHPAPVAKRGVEVRIYGEQYFIDGVECRDLDTFVTRLTRWNAVEKSVTLIDDYAETHVYKTIRRTILESGRSIGEEVTR